MDCFKNYAIYLRALEEDDYKYSVKWRADEEIWDMVMGHRYYVSEAYEKNWVKNHIENQKESIVFVVCEKVTDIVVGFLYLNNIDHQNKSCRFAKLLGNKSCWGKGYGTQATMLVLYHAFYELGMERVCASQLLTNKASIRVNEKCGFVSEGVARHAIFKKGKYVDLNMMSCLRSDYDAVLGKLSD